MWQKKALWLIVGLSIGIILTTALILAFQSPIRNILGLTNRIISYTNIIYEYRPVLISPEVKTNGELICIPANEWGSIYFDYTSYTTSNFIVYQSNDILSVRLHKREVKYAIPKQYSPRWTVGIGYTPFSTIPVNIFAGYKLLGEVGLYAMTTFDRIGVGISYSW